MHEHKEDTVPLKPVTVEHTADEMLVITHLEQAAAALENVTMPSRYKCHMRNTIDNCILAMLGVPLARKRVRPLCSSMKGCGL